MAPTGEKPAWIRQIGAARHLLVVEFWSALIFLLAPMAILLVWFAAPVRQPVRQDGIPWPPTDDWTQMFLMPGLALAILVVLGVWGLLGSLPKPSSAWFWALAGTVAWCGTGYFFPSVGSIPRFLAGWGERRTPILIACWLVGQGAFHLAWPAPPTKFLTRPWQSKTGWILAGICWIGALGFWALGYWLGVDTTLDKAIFPFVQVTLLCFVMAVAEGIGLRWRYQQLRAWAGFNLLAEEQRIQPDLQGPSSGTRI